MNCAFMKLAPKNIVFLKTSTLFDRLSFVVIIDSVGYEDGIKRILAHLFQKQDNVVDTVILEWAQREDRIKKYILLRQRTKIQKIR